MSSSIGSIRSLYLCYFGLREPLVQTQVLPYLRQLADSGLEVYLLTFEPHLRQAWTAEQRSKTEARLATQGIRWFARPYHKRPSLPATAYDLITGAVAAARLARRYRVDVLHARAQVPLAMALLAQPLTGCRIIFDLRGLVADEYADAGIWRSGSPVYRAMKWIERLGLRRADQIVVLTQRIRDWIVAAGYAGAEKIEVIPCCVDFARFEVAEREAEPRRFEVIYAGAVTGLYLLETMGRFFLALQARRPEALLRILTNGSQAQATTVLRASGLTEKDFLLESVLPEEVPGRLRRARLGISFRRPGFAQMAASPTKIAEYLAAGLPVVSNTGIGDTDELLEHERVGVVVRDFNDAALAMAAERALALLSDPSLPARCFEVARRHFDLQTVGRSGYTNVYRRLSEKPPAVVSDKITELGSS